MATQSIFTNTKNSDILRTDPASIHFPQITLFFYSLDGNGAERAMLNLAYSFAQ